MNRRLLLATLGGVSIGLAGCVNSTPFWIQSSGSFRDCEDHEPIEAQPCEDDDYVRFRPPFDEENLYYEVAAGEDDQGFELTTSTPRITFGETASFALRNRSMSRQGTGNASKYTIQQYTTDGWREVRGGIDLPPEAFSYLYDMLVHNPRGGFDWEFSVTKGGIMGRREEGLGLIACPELEAGIYRFVYWGFVGNRALGTCFEIVE